MFCKNLAPLGLGWERYEEVDTTIMDTCHYTIVYTHKMHNGKSEPYCKLQALGNVMRQCGLINCKQLMGDADDTGGDMCGTEVHGKPLHLLLSFALYLKLPYKNKVLMK